MKINESVEIEAGVVRFVGEVTGPELDLILQFGLMALMKEGIIPATTVHTESGELH